MDFDDFLSLSGTGILLIIAYNIGIEIGFTMSTLTILIGIKATNKY